MSTSKIIHVLGNNFPSYLNSLVNVVGAIFMYVYWTKLIMKAQFHWIPFHSIQNCHPMFCFNVSSVLGMNWFNFANNFL